MWWVWRGWGAPEGRGRRHCRGRSGRSQPPARLPLRSLTAGAQRSRGRERRSLPLRKASCPPPRQSPSPLAPPLQGAGGTPVPPATGSRTREGSLVAAGQRSGGPCPLPWSRAGQRGRTPCPWGRGRT